MQRKTLSVVFALILVMGMAGLAACGSATTSSSSTATPVSTGSSAAPVTTTAGSSSSTALASSASSVTAASGDNAILVSAASSLKAAFTEAGKAFDQANGSKTTFNFDASGALQKQIEGGAPVDVFASAAPKQMNALADKELVDSSTVKNFAGNSIVLVVPADSTISLTGFEDLTKADVKKITYGDPAIAPHGVAAEEILRKLNIFDQVKPKVVYAANVSQALEYVTRGEVEAGIIFATEAATAGDKIKVVTTADQAWYTKVVYPISVVASAKNKSLAQKFVDYMTGPEGQAILAKYKFLPAPTS